MDRKSEKGGATEVAEAPRVWLSGLPLPSFLCTSAHSTPCGMQDHVFHLAPQGKDSGRLNSALPLVTPSRLPLSGDYSCLVNCLLLLSYPDHYLLRAVHFQQAVLLALDQGLVRSLLEVDES